MYLTKILSAQWTTRGLNGNIKSHYIEVHSQDIGNGETQYLS